MKILLNTLTFTLLILTACNPSQRDQVPTDHGDETGQNAVPDYTTHDPLAAIWHYDFNPESEEMEITRLRQVDPDTLTGESLEKIINSTWPDVQIHFLGTSHDTAFISIPHSEVLTQQMGSAGAEHFMVTTTFSFTELKGIRYVSFDFEEGDHAVPGTYSRQSW
jgi:hypothetical protein